MTKVKILTHPSIVIKALFTTITVGVIIATGGCQQSTTTYGYSKTSLSQLKSIDGTPLNDPLANQVATQFVHTFEALGTPSFNDNANQLFADQFYLNDTLAVHQNKSSLMKYFIPMNKRVTNSKVVIINQSYTHDSLYLHWSMGFDFSLFGKITPMYSSGISHLKVNPKGQVIYQQDYWDPNNGLYRNLPMVGWFYRLLLPMH